MLFICFARVLRNVNKHFDPIWVCTQNLIKHTYFENILKLVQVLMHRLLNGSEWPSDSGWVFQVCLTELMVTVHESIQQSMMCY